MKMLLLADKHEAPLLGSESAGPLTAPVLLPPLGAVASRGGLRRGASCLSESKLRGLDWTGPPELVAATAVRAFTIIEIMLAISIFAMVLVAIYSAWSAILRGSKIALAAAADVQRTRVATRALQESLASAQIYADNLKYYAFYADTAGRYPFLSFVSRLPSSFPGSGLFQDQTLRRVTFAVDEGQLILTQSPLLEATELVGKPYTIVLSPHVDVFEMQFWDTRRRDWLSEWPYTNALPRLIRLALRFGDGTKHSLKPDEVTTRVIMMASGSIDHGGALRAAVPPITGGVPGQVPANNAQGGAGSFFQKGNR